MDILLVSKSLGRSGPSVVSRGKLIGMVAALSMVVALLSGYAGYRYAAKTVPQTVSQNWHASMERQRKELEEAKRVAEENLNAMAVRLGQMQAHVFRLDALGRRLTKMAGLDNGEFDFDNPPAQGGPEAPAGGQSLAVPDFVSLMGDLEKQLDDRNQQLNVLESMLMTRNLRAEVVPSGRPVKAGWISSPFGMRTDPFNGRREFHSGIDFAGKKGSDVIAAAAGVVTWASKRFGYGNLVQINHGNGYSTRYGHNETILVKVGQMVRKGQVIAKMGSTGRSTGPHCHFEVLKNGRAVNPAKYVAAN